MTRIFSYYKKRRVAGAYISEHDMPREEVGQIICSLYVKKHGF